jgi:hypothetical protein
LVTSFWEGVAKRYIATNLGLTPTRELRLGLKANPVSHTVKHQESKLKKLLQRKRFFWQTARVQHMCVLAKVDMLLFWKKY